MLDVLKGKKGKKNKKVTPETVEENYEINTTEVVLEEETPTLKYILEKLILEVEKRGPTLTQNEIKQIITNL